MTRSTHEQLEARIAELTGALAGVIDHLGGRIDHGLPRSESMAAYLNAKAILASDGTKAAEVLAAAKAFKKVAMPGPERLRLFEAIDQWERDGNG